MPVLGPEYQTFAPVSNIREQMLLAKEKGAVELAHGMLEPERSHSRLRTLAYHLGLLAHSGGFESRQTPLAYYEPDDDASEAGRLSMAAYFTSAGGGCLITRKVLPGNGPLESRLGPLQPRAIIAKEGYFGYPLVAIGQDDHPIFPSTMSLEDREDFAARVSETLTIINAQIYTGPPTEMHVTSQARKG